MNLKKPPELLRKEASQSVTESSVFKQKISRRKVIKKALGIGALVASIERYFQKQVDVEEKKAPSPSTD